MQEDNYLTGRQTRKELWAGIVLFVLVFMLGNLLASDKLAYTLGLLLGGAMAIGLVGHMHSSMERALLYDEDTAKKKVKLSSVLRMLFMAIALATAALLPEYLSVAGVFLGILSLKFSAYLQPLTHKVLQNFINKGR